MTLVKQSGFRRGKTAGRAPVMAFIHPLKDLFIFEQNRVRRRDHATEVIPEKMIKKANPKKNQVGKCSDEHHKPVGQTQLNLSNNVAAGPRRVTFKELKS